MISLHTAKTVLESAPLSTRDAQVVSWQILCRLQLLINELRLENLESWSVTMAMTLSMLILLQTLHLILNQSFLRDPTRSNGTNRFSEHQLLEYGTSMGSWYTYGIDPDRHIWMIEASSILYGGY
jgi:hypothetical protein